MDRLIPINITKAKVVSVYLQYKKDQLEFSAEVGLISEYGKPLTTIRVGNGNWEKESNAELSLETIDLANKVREEIEIAVIRFMNSKQNVIEHKG